MFNIRYHIASLVSVFLALALGLVLGGLIVDNTSSGTTSQVLVSGLKQEFSTLRSDNDSLKASVSAYEEFSQKIVSDSMKTALKGKTIGVLGLNNKATELAHADVTTLGGATVLITLKTDKLALDDSQDSVTQLIEELKTTYSTDNAYDALGSALCDEWARGVKKRPVTDALVESGALQISNYAKFNGLDGVIDTAIDGETPDALGLRIAEAFANAQRPAICASVEKGNNILAEQGWKRGVSSTNMLSTPIGTYTIAALLNGAQEGLYGTIEGAKATFPEMPEVTSAKTAAAL